MYTSRKVYEYISQQTNDSIVEWKICAVSGVEFPIYQSDLDFYTKISPTFAGQKFQIPTPTLCPEERTRRRLSHQNMSKLYKRKCSATGATIVSNISPDKTFPIYDSPYWWSDGWDFRSYGMEFDFTKTFTEQFQQLRNVVPQPNLGRSFLLDQNSDYTNYAGGNKNCYLIFHADMNEDSMYGVGVKKCNHCLDILHTHSSEQVYQTINCRKCYDVFYAENSEDCRSCSYIKNCYGCEFCYGCNNLSQKRYYIHNQSKTKQEYEEFIASRSVGGYEPIEFGPSSYGYQNNRTYGCSIYYSQDAKFCSDVQESKNISYSDRVYNGPNEDVYDVNEYGMNINRVYECVAVGINSSNIMTGIFVNEEVSHVYYSLHTHHSKNCFGCIGAVQAEYCIFNCQYTKEEYEIQVAKIIQHMIATGERGEFFHPSLSPFGYNETVAQEYYPVEVEGGKLKVKGSSSLGTSNLELGTYGYKRSRYSSDPNIPDTAQVIRPVEISDEDWNKLTDTDDILRQVILCEDSGRPYMIQKAELVFYRKHNLPIPRKHPDIRHEERMKLRPGRTLYLRTCDCCGEEMLSVYAKDHEGKVYCEKCYQDIVYS